MQQPQEPFQRIGLDTAKELMADGKIHVIDVREPNEWVTGHIPQATLIPLGTLINKPDAHLTADQEDPYLFVCAMGQRSAIACEVAAMMGFKHVYNLEGGTTEWIRAGNPVDR